MSEYKVIPKNEMQTREWLMAYSYDLNKALADVLFTAKVVLGECDDGQ